MMEQQPRKLEDLMKFFEDIDDPRDKNETFNKLTTNLRWKEESERQKMIKKYLSGFTSLSSISYISDMVNNDMQTKDLIYLVEFNCKDSLKIALKDVQITRFDLATYCKVFLCDDSCTIFANLFWYLFASYFKSDFSCESLISRLLSVLSQNYIKLQFTPSLQHLSRTLTDYFFDSYPFVMAEAIYCSFIRHFCCDEWIIHYRIRDRIATDLFYLFNGIQLSHICLNHHLSQLYPNGTVIPPPLSWRKRTVSYRLRKATTARTGTRRAATMYHHHEPHDHTIDFISPKQNIPCKYGWSNTFVLVTRNATISRAKLCFHHAK
eukprot:916135_1